MYTFGHGGIIFPFIPFFSDNLKLKGKNEVLFPYFIRNVLGPDLQKTFPIKPLIIDKSI